MTSSYTMFLEKGSYKIFVERGEDSQMRVFFQSSSDRRGPPSAICLSPPYPEKLEQEIRREERARAAKIARDYASNHTHLVSGTEVPCECAERIAKKIEEEG